MQDSNFLGISISVSFAVDVYGALLIHILSLSLTNFVLFICKEQ